MLSAVCRPLETDRRGTDTNSLIPGGFHLSAQGDCGCPFMPLAWCPYTNSHSYGATDERSTRAQQAQCDGVLRPDVQPVQARGGDGEVRRRALYPAQPARG